MSKRFFIALLSLAALSAQAAAAATSPKGASGLPSAQLRHMARQWAVPGMAVVRVSRASGPTMLFHGTRQLGSSLPVGPATLFRINSNTKGLTALVMAKDVSAGAFRWDMPIVRRWPGFVAGPHTLRISFEDALSHRVGLESNDLMEDVPNLALDDALGRLRYLPQQNPFRSDFLYDNYMFSAAAIGAYGSVAGWRTRMVEGLLQPLGIPDNRLQLLRLVRPDAVAPCHECELPGAPAGLSAAPGLDIAAPHVGSGAAVRLDHWRLSNSDPAGALHLSASEMARILTHLVRDVPADVSRALYQPRVADKESLVPALADDPLLGPRARSFEAIGYGLGWAVGRYHGEPVVHHSGGSLGFQSMIVWLPDREEAFAVMINVGDGDEHAAAAAAMTILDRIIGLPPMDWSAPLRRVTLANAASADAADAALLKDAGPRLAQCPRAAGTYDHPAYGKLELLCNPDGTAALRMGGFRSAQLLSHPSGLLIRWQGVRNRPIRGHWADAVGARPARLRVGSAEYLREDGAQ